MYEFIKKNIYLIILFIIILSIGFLTFLTFIDKGFIELSDQNLQILLVLNIVLLAVLFIFIFIEIKSCLLYTSPSPRDMRRSRMPSSA